jgi:hypothetical protein
MREAYGPNLIDGLPRMMPGMLDERLRALGTTDATHRKAVSFFVNAAKALDIAVPTNIAKKARNRTSNARRPKEQRNGSELNKPPKDQKNPPGDVPPPKTEGITRTVELRSGGKIWVGYSVDLFDLDSDDQAFVLELVSKLRQYGQQLPGGDASRREEPDGEVHQ